MGRVLICTVAFMLCLGTLPLVCGLGHNSNFQLFRRVSGKNNTASFQEVEGFFPWIGRGASRSLLQKHTHADLDQAIADLAKARTKLHNAMQAKKGGGKRARTEQVEEASGPDLASMVSSPSSSSAASPGELPQLADPATAGVPLYGSCSARSDCPSAKMFCIDGNCRCPVFLTGPDCDQPITPHEPWCLTPLKSWARKAPVYKKLSKEPIDFTSCAVVGSSGKMKKANLGAQIDKHTAVFRFNEAPASKAYAKDVGSFTTLRFQNRDRSGFAEQKGEICVVRSGKWQSGQDSGGKCRFMQMPTDLEHYVDGHWKYFKNGPSKPLNDPGRPFFSNGFTGIAFAMHLCGRVDVYGYTFATGYYFPKAKGSAKGWGRRGANLRPPSKSLERRHSWKRERGCLKFLSEKYPAQVGVQLSVLE